MHTKQGIIVFKGAVKKWERHRNTLSEVIKGAVCEQISYLLGLFLFVVRGGKVQRNAEHGC